MHKRQAGFHVVQISFIHPRGFVTQQSRLNNNTCCAKMSKAFSGNLWIQILDRRDDSIDPGGN